LVYSDDDPCGYGGAVAKKEDRTFAFGMEKHNMYCLCCTEGYEDKARPGFNKFTFARDDVAKNEYYKPEESVTNILMTYNVGHKNSTAELVLNDLVRYEAKSGDDLKTNELDCPIEFYSLWSGLGFGEKAREAKALDVT